MVIRGKTLIDSQTDSIKYGTSGKIIR